MNEHIILGKGEIAKAIGQHLIGCVYYYDKGEWEDLEYSENEEIPYRTILHITIPFTSEINNIIYKAQKIFHPNITVIHSTVKPGFIDYEADILYSPVIGRHNDDLAQSIKQFKKFFAGKRYTYDMVAEHIDLNNEYWGEDTESLEYSKIMSTSYMYWNLVYEKILYAECQKHGYDYTKVYKRWNRNYNNGYHNQHPEWMRPVYEHVDDKKPGGHCLSPNINLVDNKITEILREWEGNKNESR